MGAWHDIFQICIYLDLTLIFPPSSGNETDLSSAQQMESQTKLRVETIDHEINMERTRHAEAVAVLEAKTKESDETKAKTIESIDEKKAMVEAKKDELAKIWAVSGRMLNVHFHLSLLVHLLTHLFLMSSLTL